MNKYSQDKIEASKLIIETSSICIRDVDNGEEPFVYSSGNRGPGYIMIKGLVGNPICFQKLCMLLSNNIYESKIDFDFINGNVTGGMIPAWQLRSNLSQILSREIPYCYLRGSRKKGGHNELITGIYENPLIKLSQHVLIVEELVNYGQTTANAVQVFRDHGYKCTHACCILSYDHKETNSLLKQMNVELLSLITLPELLEIAESLNLIPHNLINSYKKFIQDPVEWQLSRNMLIPQESVDDAISKGYKMEKIFDKNEAINLGAPESKIHEGFEYWKKIC